MFVAFTASGRPWYRGEAGYTLFYEPDCDGEGSAAFGDWWVLNTVEPSITAVSDLDGEFEKFTFLCLFALMIYAV